MLQSQSVSPNLSESHLPKRVAILAGEGDLPFQLIENLQKKNIQYVYVDLAGNEKVDTVKVPLLKTKISKPGKIIRFLKSEKADSIVLVGRLPRPNFFKIIPDITGIGLLLNIIFTRSFSDDKLFRKVVQFCENKGFNVLGIDALAPEILAPKGLLNNVSAPNSVELDAEYGFEIAKKIGEFDIGQAVVIEDKLVLGVEAAEGTDNLIKRCADLKRARPTLVKVLKPFQETKVDLPTIGPQTIMNLAEGGYACLCIEAEKTIILKFEETVKLADKYNISILSLCLK